ncbi:MAG: hypothetical protein FWC76_05605 [Defluviitaleaceae bacterium]|nr:hypothetical protein [Defluviitaleaceae bacterium]
MDWLQADSFVIYILILMLFIGVFFIIYGIVTRKDNGNVASKKSERSISFPIKVDRLEASLLEDDEAANLLGGMSKDMFKELDGKYQELLFLYNLVDEKQKSLSSDTPVVKQSPSSDFNKLALQQMLLGDGKWPEEKPTAAPVPHNHKNASVKNLDINPKFTKVLELSKSGKTVEDIAKALEMGKGEVTLILNIEGRRKNA